MWREGIVDWIVLGSGYVLAGGLFAWLGGIARPGDAITRWGRWASTHEGRNAPTLTSRRNDEQDPRRN